MSNKTPPRPKTIRCAIYTRKSTEEGLDQQFNSLDAQREAAEAYIRSQTLHGLIERVLGHRVTWLQLISPILPQRCCTELEQPTEARVVSLL
jgi:hypothetical protein